jgi:hypothetical protein
MKLFLKYASAALLMIAAPLLHAKPMVTGITNDSLGILRQNAHVSIKAPAAQIPEPGRFVLLGSGLLGFARVVRRRFLLRS